MTLSMPGLIGAGIGLVLALVTYIAMSNVMLRPLADLKTPPEERAKIEQSWATARTILLADFVVLAAVGYYAGMMLGS